MGTVFLISLLALAVIGFAATIALVGLAIIAIVRDYERGNREQERGT
jgi:hypothetical protein